MNHLESFKESDKVIENFLKSSSEKITGTFTPGKIYRRVLRQINKVSSLSWRTYF